MTSISQSLGDAQDHTSKHAKNSHTMRENREADTDMRDYAHEIGASGSTQQRLGPRTDCIPRTDAREGCGRGAHVLNGFHWQAFSNEASMRKGSTESSIVASEDQKGMGWYQSPCSALSFRSGSLDVSLVCLLCTSRRV